MATKLGSLLIELGLDSAKFRSGLQQSERQMTGFQRNVTRGATAVKAAFAGMVAIVAADSFRQAINSGLEYASSLQEAGAQAGVTAQALQEYRYAATQAGISTEEMDAALTKLTRSIGQAANGNETIANAFTRLGVSVRDAQGNVRNAADVMPDLAEGLSRLGTSAERSAEGAVIFGRSYANLEPLMMEGAAGVNAMRDAAHDLGIVLSDELIAAADASADKMAGFRMIVDARMAAFVAENAAAIDNLSQSLANLAAQALNAFAALSRVMQRNAEVNAEADRLRREAGVAPMGDSWFRLRRIAPNEPRGGFTGQARRNVRTRETVRGLGETTGTILRAFGLSAPPRAASRFAAADIGEGTAAGSGGGGGGGRSRGGGGGSGASEAAASARELASGLEALERRFRPAAAAARELEETTTLLNRALAEGKITGTQYRVMLAGIQAETSNGGEGITDWHAMAAETFEENNRALEAWRASLPSTQEAAADLADAFVESAERQQEAAEKSRQALYDTLSSLRNFANSIKGGDIFGILEGLIGILDAIGGMREGGLNIGGIQFGSGARTRIPGFANGTNFAPGGLAWVGERGRELVNLPRGAQVVPNHKLGEMGAQTRVVVEASPYFDVRVDGRIQSAAPNIAAAGAAGGLQAQSRMRQRSLR